MCGKENLVGKLSCGMNVMTVLGTEMALLFATLAVCLRTILRAILLCWIVRFKLISAKLTGTEIKVLAPCHSGILLSVRDTIFLS